jgi:hypothetical protein
MDTNMDRDAWVERVLGVTVTHAEPASDSAFDEVAAEGPLDQALLRADEIRAVHAAISRALPELKIKVDKIPPSDLKGPKATNARYLAKSYPDSTAKLQELRKVDLTALQNAADFRGLRTQYDEAVRLLGSVQKSLGVAPAIPALDHPGTADNTEITAAKNKYGDNLASELQKRMDILATWMASCSNFNPLNPVQAMFGRLTDEAQEAGKLEEAAKKDTLARLCLATSQASTAAKQAITVRRGIANRIHVLTVLLKDADNTDFDSRITDLREACKADCMTANSIADLSVKWAARVPTLDQLELEVRNHPGVTPAENTEQAKQKLAAVIADLHKGAEPLQLFLDSGKSQTDAEALAKRLETLEAAFQTTPDDAPKLLAEAYELSFRAKPVGDIGTAVDGARETIADPASQALCKAALTAKFNLKLTIPDGMTVTRLPALFELLSRVPAGHTGHKKLLELAYETNPGASSYKEAKIVLTKLGPEDKGRVYTGEGGAEEELGYFTTCVLHEVGHSVDDKDSVMRDHGGASGFGQWDSLKLDGMVQKLYDASFKVIDFTDPKPVPAHVLAAVRQLLQTGQCDKPPSARAPLGSLAREWDKFVASPGFKLCLEMRDPGQKPWEKVHMVGDTMSYHEAYTGDWTGYAVAERTAKSVQLYQWRARIEWFAELYAWYYAEKDTSKRPQRAGFLPEGVRPFITG